MANNYGQLGDGATSTRTTPRDVSGLSGGVVAIAAGDSHTCALLATGGVKCWGYNNYGQLGDGTSGSAVKKRAPTKVSGLAGGVTKLTAGDSHTCAVLESGGMECWGLNNSGQLGDGTSWRTTPVEVVRHTGGFRLVRAGRFTMGSPDDEIGRGGDEAPHEVLLTHHFEMQAAETTQEQFAAFAGKNPSWFGPNADGLDCGNDCPVERVNWYEALAYANWMSARAGLPPCYVLDGCQGTIGGGCAANAGGCDSATFTCSSVTLNALGAPQSCIGFRLPTESEWEYAARAGTVAAFHNGDSAQEFEDPNMSLIGWYYFNSDSGSGYATHPGGGKADNSWGIYDMSGNVAEWVWDRYDAYPGAATDPVGADTGSGRVIRGGDWNRIARYCRSASRDSLDPGSRRNDVGFRLVRTLPDKAAWEFNVDGYAEGWQLTRITPATAPANGVWTFAVSEDDPWMQLDGLTLRADHYRHFACSVKNCTATSTAQVFWGTVAEPFLTEQNQQTLTIAADCQWHSYQVDLTSNAGWSGTVTILRFDPVTHGNGDISIDWLRLLQ